MQITENDFKKPVQRLDDWDKVLAEYGAEQKKVQLSENNKEKKEHVISFRVTPDQHKKIMARFGDPSGVRSVLLSEIKNTKQLHEITIQESSGGAVELK